MNADAALNKFVSHNFVLLTSETLTKDAFKASHRKFFVEQHQKRFGIPGLRDICTCLVKMMLSRGLPPENVLTHIDTLPVFRLAGDAVCRDLKALSESGAYRSKLSAEELNLLQKTSAFEAVERHLGKQIEERTQRQIDELDRKLKQKQDEYDSLPSVLDETEHPEPDFDPAIEEVKTWWERFYLKSNPFPRKDGLSSIEKDLYESVVVKTNPFKQMLGTLSRSPDCLFNTAFLLLGGFGFGKTTFMDYLSYYLVRQDVVPLRITSGKTHVTASGFLDAFYVRLATQLREEAAALGMTIPPEQGLEIEDSIIALCRGILQRKHGIVVFLDDYHKHQSAATAVFEFLGMLQILKDNLTRADLKVGFIVSGLPAWQSHLATHSQMSGFFDSPVVAMPDITVDMIAAVFNQRIRAYCYDTQPRNLRIEFIENIFKTIGPSGGCRDYLNRIITELENNNFSIVDSPIVIDDEELASIKSLFERDPALKASMRKLVYESKFKRFVGPQVNKCLELLVQVNLQDGVCEKDALFIGNLHYFQRLRDVTLIQKQKARRPQGDFRWVAHKRLQQAISDVRAQFHRGVSDYLLKLYAGEGYKNRIAVSSSIPAEHPQIARLLSCDLPQAVKDNIRDAQRLYEATQIPEPTAEQRRQIVDRMRTSVNALLTAFFHLDESAVLFSRVQLHDAEARLRFHWIGDEASSEAFTRLHAFDVDQSQLSYERAMKQSCDVFRNILDHLVSLTQDMSDPSRPAPFRHRAIRHTDREIAVFQQIEQDYFTTDGEKHFGYVQKITDYLEERFRAFLYVTTNAVFGEAHYFDHVPKADRKYAQKNADSRPVYSCVGNLFDGFTRPQFRGAFREGHIRTLVTSAIPIKWTDKDWALFFDLFAEENIATAHKQHATYSPADRNRYAQYCRLAEELTAQMNLLASRLIEQSTFVLVTDPKNEKPLLSDCTFKFAFQIKPKEDIPPTRILSQESPLFLYADVLGAHGLRQEAFDKVMANIAGKMESASHYSEDLVDIEYLRTHYDVTVMEFLCSLVYAKYVQKVIDVSPWFGSSVLIRRR